MSPRGRSQSPPRRYSSPSPLREYRDGGDTNFSAADLPVQAKDDNQPRQGNQWKTTSDGWNIVEKEEGKALPEGNVINAVESVDDTDDVPEAATAADITQEETDEVGETENAYANEGDQEQQEEDQN